MIEIPHTKGVRIVMGCGGFFVFVLSAFCPLFLISENYITGTDDSSGMFGIVALVLLGLFVGSNLLYNAFRRATSAESSQPTDE